jgi:hypothetical protein
MQTQFVHKAQFTTLDSRLDSVPSAIAPLLELEVERLPGLPRPKARLSMSISDAAPSGSKAWSPLIYLGVLEIKQLIDWLEATAPEVREDK